MNKTETRRHINKSFYEFVNANFPKYEICDDGDGGRVNLVNMETNDCDDGICYTRSYHSVLTLSKRSDVKRDVEAMQVFLDNMCKQHNMK